MKHTPRTSNAAFTLTEVMMAGFIIVVLSGLAVTHHFRERPRYLLERAALQVATDLSAARMRAITESLPVEVSFSCDLRAYTIWADSNTNGLADASEQDLRTLDASPGIGVASATQQGIFASRGTFVSTGGVWLINFDAPGVGSRQVYVFPSGQVRCTENELQTDTEPSDG
jgi:Tfp pilus assembly protein FimT